MSKTDTKTILSAIESPLRWNEVCRRYTKSTLISLAETCAEGSPFELVQSVKILDYTGAYVTYSEFLLDRMRCLIKAQKIATIPQPFIFYERKDCPSKAVILCCNVSSKIKILASNLLAIDIPIKIACISNFSLNKLYSKAMGTWYYNHDVVSNSIKNLSVEYFKNEQDFISIHHSDLADFIGISIGAGVFGDKLIRAFPYGIVNIHNGLLPEIRGLDSPAWSLLTGHEYGVSLHFINHSIDLGDRI